MTDTYRSNKILQSEEVDKLLKVKRFTNYSLLLSQIIDSLIVHSTLCFRATCNTIYITFRITG